MSPKGAEISLLLWLHVDVCPHLVGRTMFDHDLTSIDRVLDVEIPYLYVLSPFQTTSLAFCFK
jgi:hypothetical protein